MKEVVLNTIKYDLIKEENDCFNYEEVKEMCTEYFNDFDYIVGDFAYNKLRLKGFNDEKNPKVKTINNYKFLDKYLKEHCAYGCDYFILKKK